MAASDASSSIIKVEIQSKKWIKPATPTPLHLQRYQLSVLDQLQFPSYISLIFHFNCQTTPKRLDRLKESLSEVLTLYYPLAGRYNSNEDDSCIACQDQGVELVVAIVDCKADELVDGEYDKKALLISEAERLQSTSHVSSIPVVLVQANVFRCGGLAIGIGFLHKVGDVSTLSMFMNAWATACRLGTLDNLVRPSFNNSFLLPPRPRYFPPKPSSEIINLESKAPPPPPPKYVMKRFVFTGEGVAKLKSATSSDSEASYTRVELVTALITRTLIKIKSPEQQQLTTRRLALSHVINLRSRLTLPLELPDYLVGNFGMPVTATLELVNDESWELPELARMIRDSIRNAASEIRKIHDWRELSEKTEKGILEVSQGTWVGEEKAMITIRLMFSSLFRFSLYEVDFGWGRPSLVSITPPAPFLFIFLTDYKADAGGIEAWLNLEEHDMARFKHDPDILEYVA